MAGQADLTGGPRSPSNPQGIPNEFLRNEANGRWTIRLTRGLIYRETCGFTGLTSSAWQGCERVRNLYIVATHGRRTPL